MAMPETVPATKPRVLLLGNYRPTLTLARELSTRGYDVLSGLAGCDGGAEHSRFVTKIWDHPSVVGEPDLFLAALEQFVDAERIDIVYPVLEEYVALFANRSVERVSRAVVASVPPDIVRKCLDKNHMMQLAEELDVPLEPFAEVTDYTALIDEATRLGFPLVARPAASTRRLDDVKALIILSADDLTSELPKWPEGQPSLMLQEMVAGRRFNVYFSALGGQMIGSVHTVIKETDHRDGTGLAVDGEAIDPVPDLQSQTGKLIRALNYSGVGCAQFMVDEDTGRTSFLEINPRIVGSHVVAEHAGLELSEFPIKLALGQKIDTTPFTGKTGFSYVWTFGALQAAKTAWSLGKVGNRELLAWIWKIARAFFGARVHMVFSLRDPMPALMSLLTILPDGRRLLWRAGRAFRGQPRSAMIEDKNGKGKNQSGSENLRPLSRKP